MQRQDAFPATFHTRPWLRRATAGACVFWFVMTVWIVGSASWQQAEVPAGTYLSLLFFDFFFATVATYYHHRRVIVDQEGVIIAGVWSFAHYRWDEIRRLVAHVDFLPGVIVHTHDGSFAISSFEFEGYEALVTLLATNLARGVSLDAQISLQAPSLHSPPQRRWRRKSRRRRRGG